MFNRDEVAGFDDATPEQFPQSSGASLISPLKRRKRLSEVLKFWTVNAVVCPPAFIVAVTVGAEGLRNQLDLASMKLHKLPLPMVEQMQSYQGFRDLDLAFVASGLTCIATGAVLVRTFKEMKGEGSLLTEQLKGKAIVYVYALIGLLLVAADMFIFYIGVKARGGGWGDMPGYVPFACTTMYFAAVSAFAAFHADYDTYTKV